MTKTTLPMQFCSCDRVLSAGSLALFVKSLTQRSSYSLSLKPPTVIFIPQTVETIAS
jgi:hypothetical protein